MRKVYNEFVVSKISGSQNGRKIGLSTCSTCTCTLHCRSDHVFSQLSIVTSVMVASAANLRWPVWRRSFGELFGWTFSDSVKRGNGHVYVAVEILWLSSVRLKNQLRCLLKAWRVSASFNLIWWRWRALLYISAQACQCFSSLLWDRDSLRLSVLTPNPLHQPVAVEIHLYQKNRLVQDQPHFSQMCYYQQ